MFIYILYSIVGIIVGISMGITGIGAGLLTITLLSYLGVDIKQAVGVCMIMQLFPQSVAGVYNYWNHTDIFMSMLVTIFSFFGIWIGSYLVKENYVSELFIYKLITLFLFFTTIVFYLKYIRPHHKYDFFLKRD